MADSFSTNNVIVLFKIPFINLYVVKWNKDNEIYIAKKFDESYYFL